VPDATNSLRYNKYSLYCFPRELPELICRPKNELVILNKRVTISHGLK